MGVYRRLIFISMVLVFFTAFFDQGFAKDAADGIVSSKPDTTSSKADDEYKLSGMAELGEMLKSGKPTLAYFYQSVACSCVAAQCALAGTVIDSVSEIQNNNRFNFSKIDIFYTETADSLYHVDIVPVFVFYNDKGREVNRLEWDISVDLFRKLINSSEKKLGLKPK